MGRVTIINTSNNAGSVLRVGEWGAEDVFLKPGTHNERTFSGSHILSIEEREGEFFAVKASNGRVIIPRHKVVWYYADDGSVVKQNDLYPIVYNEAQES